MKHVLILLLSFLSFSAIHAQTKKVCDSVYYDVDSLAVPPGGNDSLIAWMNTQMRDAFNDCNQFDSTEITGLTINLVIGKKGQVLEATFGDADIAAGCRERMRKKLLAMRPWKPGRHKGKPVCSYYSWLVGGVLWENQ